MPALAYPLKSPRAEALDLLQEGGAFVNDVEGPDAEDLNDLAGKTWPDSLDQPSRTLMTKEGGTSPSRFKHIIVDPDSGAYRVLTPVECERLNQFPDDWTNTGMPPNWRYFCMGNALVVGLIERMGRKLAERIQDTPEPVETSVTPVSRATAVSSAR